MMLGSKKANLTTGTRVRVRTPGAVPEWSSWDEDQRVSNPVKKRLQAAFFRGDKKVNAAVAYVTSETQRERLKSKGLVKVELRDPAGASVVITAEAASLIAA